MNTIHTVLLLTRILQYSRCMQRSDVFLSLMQKHLRLKNICIHDAQVTWYEQHMWKRRAAVSLSCTSSWQINQVIDAKHLTLQNTCRHDVDDVYNESWGKHVRKARALKLISHVDMHHVDISMCWLNEKKNAAPERLQRFASCCSATERLHWRLLISCPSSSNLMRRQASAHANDSPGPGLPVSACLLKSIRCRAPCHVFFDPSCLPKNDWTSPWVASSCNCAGHTSTDRSCSENEKPYNMLDISFGPAHTYSIASPRNEFASNLSCTLHCNV